MRNKSRYCIIILVSCCLCFCKDKNAPGHSIVIKSHDSDSSTRVEKEMDSLEEIIKTEKVIPSNFITYKGDTLTVNEKAAIIIEPDTLQIATRMKHTKEEEFRAGMDDYLYYMNESGEYLGKQGIKTYRIKGKTLLRFIKTDNSLYLVNTDTLPELWNIFLFTPNKEPHQADILSMQEEYSNYFKNGKEK